MHLTDEQLNEFLDNETEERAQIEAHLSACDHCTARLTALQSLFDEIESLPEVTLSRNPAVQFARPSSLTVSGLPRWLRLTASLQAVFAGIALITTAPLIMRWIVPYFSGVQVPSSASVFLELQSLWLSWVNIFSRLQVPTLPSLPAVELSSLMIVLTLVGVSILWLVGNGLLLRNQIK